MPRMRAALLIRLVAPLLLLAGAMSAEASEILKLKNGDLVPGTALELDDAGVTFAREQGGKFRVAWTEVLPISRYELRAARIEAGDSDGRLALADWALGERLFHQARKEAQKAQGAGDDAESPAAALLGRIARLEADAALADIDARIADGKLDGALGRARAYLRVAPPGDEADRVRARVPDILVRIERAEAEAREVEEAEAEATRSGRKEVWIEQNLTRAVETKLAAQETAIEAYAYLAKGNQTRARRALTSAEKDFTASRLLLKKVRRVAGPGEIAEQCEREMKDSDRRTVDLLTRWGELEVGNRAWKKADGVVDRGLRIDPVDSSLLDLRRRIDEGWIRRKASDITNARGRESSQ